MPAQSAARHSYGSSLHSAPWTVPDPDVFTQLGSHTETSIAYGSLKSIGFGGRSFSDVPITHLLSPDQVKEYMPGLEEGGEIELAFHYSPVVLAAIYSLLPSVTRTFPDYGSKRWKVVDYAGNYVSVTGYLHPPNIQYEEDQPIAITTKIKNSKGRATITAI